jgi:hypothetical protein
MHFVCMGTVTVQMLWGTLVGEYVKVLLIADL